MPAPNVENNSQVQDSSAGKDEIMEISLILSKCDHTLLKPEATWEDIKAVVDDGIRFRTASVCIPPVFVKRAAEYASGRIKICTVIGFPHGNNAPETKVFETRQAIEDGADEIDMVINIGELKAGNDAYVLEEIRAVKSACEGRILKVIIETCLLSKEEKIRACRIVTESGADFIKTSTGFGGGGANIKDVELIKENIGPDLKIKASGGISGLKDAEAFIRLGAERLGTSRIVKAVKDLEQGFYKQKN